jgi:hypothetical protein
LENLLEIDGPSVVECFNALADAEQAIREAAEQEEVPLVSAVKPALKIAVPPTKKSGGD